MIVILDGNTYSTSGTYTNVYTNSVGCDSTHTLNQQLIIVIQDQVLLLFVIAIFGMELLIQQVGVFQMLIITHLVVIQFILKQQLINQIQEI